MRKELPVMANEKKVDYRFKLLYAISMVLVVKEHANGEALSFLQHWFPTDGMLMGMFTFASGYFYHAKAEANIGSYIIKKFRHLMIPIFLYNLAYGIFIQITRLKGFTIGGDFTLWNLLVSPLYDGHAFLYNLGGWYMVSLFYLEVCHVLLRKLISITRIKIHEGVFFAAGCALGVLGAYLAGHGWSGHHAGLKLVIVRVLYFVPYFDAGIIYKRVFEKYDRRIPSFPYFLVIFAVKYMISLRYGKMPRFFPSWCEEFYYGIFTPTLSGLLGVAFWFRVCTILEPVLGRSKAVNLIADNTYSITINHFFGFMTLKTIFGLLSHVIPSVIYYFDWDKFKSDIWWFYWPKELPSTTLLYVAAGVLVPILIQQGLNFVKKKIPSMIPALRKE